MSLRLPSHDDFVRAILSDRQIAIDYLKSFLPPAIVQLLDFNEFRQLPETYLSDELRKTVSDIIYSCKLKTVDRWVKVTLLIEHKSHPDKFTPIQIGSYIFSAWQKQIKNKEELSPIIPMLLYHGEKRWKYETLGSIFEYLNEELKPFLPSYEYILNDLGVLDDKQLANLNNKFLGAAVLALKHAKRKEWLERNAFELFTLASEGPEGLRKSLIIYIGGRSDLPENVLYSLPESIKTEVMNTLEIYYEKGLVKGHEQGIEKGIQQGKIAEVRNLIVKLGFNDEKAAEIAEVSVDFVKKVRSSL